MKYCSRKDKRGPNLRPSTKWNGDCNFESAIHGKSDSEYTKRPDTRKRVSGYIPFLCDAVATVRILMQRIVEMCVSKDRNLSATQCNQDMLYMYRIINISGLKVKFPMNIEVGN